MKKKTGSHKRTQKRKTKNRVIIWVYILTVVLIVFNLLLLDTLISIKKGWHFLPMPFYAPFSSIFSHKVTKENTLPFKKYAVVPHDISKDSLLKHKAKHTKRSKGKIPLKPTIALVIDDLGYNPELAEELFKLDFPFTVSVLPNLRHSSAIANRAVERGKEVLLHLPMEPYDYPNIQVERGTILTSMEDSQIREMIEKALKGLECAVGANNHMGSRLVENEDKMRIILDEMKKKGLFFLDSRTSPRSKVPDIAQRLGVKAIERDVFLDGQSDINYIHTQMDKVVNLAKDNGYGIAIGHLHPTTIHALKTYLPKLRDGSIKIVKLSEVIE